MSVSKGWPKTREECEAYIVSERVRFGYTSEDGCRRKFLEAEGDRLARVPFLTGHVWVFHTVDLVDNEWERTVHIVDDTADLVVVTDARNWYDERVNVRRMTPEKYVAIVLAEEEVS